MAHDSPLKGWMAGHVERIVFNASDLDAPGVGADHRDLLLDEELSRLEADAGGRRRNRALSFIQSDPQPV